MSRWTFLRPKESGFAIEPRLKKARAFPGLNEAVMSKTDFDLASRTRSGNTGMSWSPAPERSSGRQPTVNRSGATASGSVKSPADVRARSPPPNNQQPVDKPCRRRASRTGPEALPARSCRTAALGKSDCPFGVDLRRSQPSWRGNFCCL